ncbi:uncharacterized protein METZ01_LOCUS208969 [marine metagenome]|uniref:Uncharacterized protein n=1 Tax=marine metagenome TaxID=408172 RepID=A0A382F0A8_9ZZZZ
MIDGERIDMRWIGFTPVQIIGKPSIGSNLIEIPGTPIIADCGYYHQGMLKMTNQDTNRNPLISGDK